MAKFKSRPGRPSPLGATLDPDGVNFAVYSRGATAVTLCLFNKAGIEEQRIPLLERNQRPYVCLVLCLILGPLGHTWRGHPRAPDLSTPFTYLCTSYRRT